MATRISNLDSLDRELTPAPGVEIGEPEIGHVQMFARFRANVGGTDLPPYTVFNVRDADVELFCAHGYRLLLEG